MDRKTIKQLGKENRKKQWGELLLAPILAAVGITVASIISFGLGSLVVTGPLQFGLLYIYYQSTQGEKVGQMMLLEGFKKKFGESFLCGILTQVIVSIPILVLFFVSIGSISSMAKNMLAGGAMGALSSEERQAYKELLKNDDYKDLAHQYGISTSSAGAVVKTILLIVLIVVLIIVCLYIYYGIRMAMYILIREGDKTRGAAISKSWAMMKGQRLRMFVFDLSFIGWWLLCLITAGILLIWIVPYYLSARTILMTDIYSNSNVAENPEFSFKNEFNDIKDMAGNMTGANKTYGPQGTQTAGTAAGATGATSGFVYCRNCGAQLRAGAKFCGKCGAKQE